MTPITPVAFGLMNFPHSVMVMPWFVGYKPEVYVGTIEKLFYLLSTFRLCLQAEFFAYIPQSVMCFGYTKRYLNTFVPIILAEPGCIPDQKNFAYPKMHTPFPPTIFTTKNKRSGTSTMSRAADDSSGTDSLATPRP